MYSQVPVLKWAKGIGGSTLNDTGYGIRVDANGNVYSAGYFGGTVDFDPGTGVYNLTASGSADIFISKLDSLGNFVWAKRVGGSGQDYAYNMTLDSAANVFVTGYYTGTVDFDPGASVASFSTASPFSTYILKLDANGNYKWAKVVSPGLSMGMAVSVDNNGYVYGTGCFRGAAVDFNPGPAVNNLASVTTSYWDIFVLKLDSLGNYVWAKAMGGATDDEGYDIATDTAGNVYTTGYFSGTADFNPGAAVFNIASAGDNDAIVSKLDASGNFVWAKSIAGTGMDYPYSLELDAANNIYVAGSFQYTSDFDPGVGVSNMVSAGSNDIFVVKWNALGNLVWSKKMGGTAQEQCRSIVLDPSGNIYTTGLFQGTADMDPGSGVYNLSSFGGTNFDIYISKLDSIGNFVWARGMGNNSTDHGMGMTIDTAGNLYYTGFFSSTVDFDPGVGVFNLTAAGSAYDVYILKIKEGPCSSTPSSPGSISGGTTICSSASNTYSIAAVPGATSYTWTLPAGWTGSSTTNSITPTASSSSGNITVTANNSCGNSTPQTLTVTVNAIPGTPGTISGSTTVCAGTSNTYSITAVAGATSYTWILPPGWTGTSTTNSITTIASSTPGNITVTANNSCGISGSQTLAVTVNSIPGTPGTISGSVTICSGTSNTYSISAVAGATSYTWSLPSGWTGTSVTNSINATASGTSGNITVTANNGCGNSGPQTFVVIVNAVPSAPGTISGSTSVCLGTTNTYSVVNDPSATSYTWMLPSGWVGTSATNSISATAGATGGSISVVADNLCGTSTTSMLSVSIVSIAGTPGTISGPVNVCAGTTNTYSISSVPGASSYTWTVPAGWTGGGSATMINPIAGSSGGNITVTADNICGSSSPQTLAVIVNALPTVTYSQTPAMVCVNVTSVTLSGESPSGGTYSGTSVSGSTINASTAGAGTHTITYSYTDVNGCSDTANSSIVVDLCTGFVDSYFEETMSLYPNPFLDKIIVSNTTGKENYELINSLGQTVWLGSEIEKQDFSELSKGVYMLKVTKDNSARVVKMVKR